MPADRNASTSRATNRGRDGNQRGRGTSSGGGRGGRARGGRGGGGRGGGRSRYTPYRAPDFPPSQVCSFSGPSGGYSNVPPQFDATRLDAPGIRKVYFSASFDVTDAHLDAIRSRPGLAASLKCLTLGDSDTGYGAHISDNGVTALSNACPNLVAVRLEAATRITDDALIAICSACPLLESLHISGNDKVHGNIRGPGLTFLAENPAVAPNLKDLGLLDQTRGGQFEKTIKQLSKTRKTLAITTGETLGDGYADNMIAAMTGGAGSEVMLNGKMVSFGVDMGMFGGGGYEFDF